MKIENQRYQFVPRGGDASAPIQIIGLQEYSPGQSRKFDHWLLRVPEQHRQVIPDGIECDSFGAVLRVLARAYFDGDVTKAQSAISS
jgi:hypothetical protein